MGRELPSTSAAAVVVSNGECLPMKAHVVSPRQRDLACLLWRRLAALRVLANASAALRRTDRLGWIGLFVGRLVRLAVR